MQFGQRNIKSGKEYEKYFAAPDNDVTKYGNNSVDYNVHSVIPKVVNKYKWQAEKIADLLYNKDLEKFCYNIWEFLFNHIQYEFDVVGREQFRTPYRSWADREQGIDCDCFSIFTSCILSVKKIPHCIRITKYDYRPDWQHIYVIVPKKGIELNPYEPETYYTIDAVIHSFDTEKEFTDQKTYYMDGQLGIVTEVLHGLGSENNDEVVETLLGLGKISGKELDIIKKHIVQTREWISNNPTLYKAQGGDPITALKMYDYAIDNFDKGETIRNKAFEVLAQNEARYNREVLKLDDADLDGVIDDDDYQFSALGELGKTKTERKAARTEKKAAKQEKKAAKKEIKAQSKIERKQENKDEKAERKQERQEAQGFFRKVGTAIKQGGEAVFVKYNPAIIAARQGFLFSIKLNLFKLANRLAPAYTNIGSEKQIKAAKKRLEKTLEIFNDKLQGSSAELKEAVLIGNKGEQATMEGIALFGLGFVVSTATAASVLSATSILASVIKAMKSVDDEEGVDYNEFELNGIDDDYIETIEFLRGLDALGEGEEAAGQIIAQITQYIKSFFEKIKARRSETKDMSKEEKKAYNQTKKEEARAQKGNGTNAGNFVKRLFNSEDNKPQDTNDIEKAIAVSDNNPGPEQKSWIKRNWWIIPAAISGIAAIVTGIKVMGKNKKANTKGLGETTTTTKVIKYKL